MDITVIGCGRWGSCIAWYLSHVKMHNVKLYGRTSSVEYQNFLNTRMNEYLILPDEIILTDDLEYAVDSAQIIVVSIGAQQFRSFLRDLRERVHPENKTFVLCMKGLEAGTGKRLTQVFNEEIGAGCSVAIWVGPGHVQDFYTGKPSCMMIGSDDIELTKMLVSEFNSSLIRFYYGQDLIGSEIGAAAKNVMGIAAGIIDGFGYESLKGALMARGAREIARLVRVMGGNELTVYGLSHLGDYQATLFSEYSHNRMFGEKLIKGEKMDKLAEGVDTAKALVKLSILHNVDLPISQAVYDVVFEAKNAAEVFDSLFDRENKFEF
ncbi:MAG: NAD(P)H-dependent glycerol-3-phosphate dehydrogenase [Clostridiales bacterium]|jgi:glycerol-3-phosphate dehydrogenase (NAD(P)+)|nr:NAD(P)H-dependent glycerol-3-phosphate dehydrogenase [Clostridiales bacterium]